MTGETLDFTANSSGHQSPAPGNLAFNQIELHRIDKRQAEVQEEKDGAVVGRVREKLSTDGNELTITTVARITPIKSPCGPEAGGKGRPRPVRGRADRGPQREPSAAKAGFDGKQYDLKNSRNDTVVLELVDPRTVESVYRRGDQVTQKDRWVLSADGQLLTLTTTGTLETGQRLTEKLLFRKR